MQISVPFKALSSPIFWFRSCKRVERRPAGAARNPFPVCAGSLRVKSLAEISAPLELIGHHARANLFRSANELKDDRQVRQEIHFLFAPVASELNLWLRFRRLLS